MISVPWSALRQIAAVKGALQYVEDANNIYTFLIDGGFAMSSIINKSLDATDKEDFEVNFKPTANINLWQSDSDGAQIVRMKAAKRGWAYAAIPIEFKTAEIGSLYSKLADGTNRPGITLKFLDANDNEITQEGLLEINESTIIKTVIDFEPTYDYEVIGGQLRIEQDITSAQDCRLWIIAVPDVPAEAGGSKEMTGGINLRFLAPQNSFEVDGRVSKFLQYSPVYHTNKLRFMFKHTAGLKVWIHLTLELYRL